MARITAAEAGRRGGQSRSPAKVAAARRNGFQPCKKVEPRSLRKRTRLCR